MTNERKINERNHKKCRFTAAFCSASHSNVLALCGDGFFSIDPSVIIQNIITLGSGEKKQVMEELVKIRCTVVL